MNRPVIRSVTAAMLAMTLAPVSIAESTEESLQRLKERGFSGVVLIAKGDKILAQQAYGSASCDGQIPNRADTVLAIGSITKMFTAAAIAQLADAGRLKLDGTLGEYLDDVPEDKAKITIRQLLNHTSGLRTYHETTNEGDFQPMSKEEAVEVIMRRKLKFAPGEREAYSNSGYTLLAVLVERVSGQSYTAYVRKHLLQPSGMNATGFWGETFQPVAATPAKIDGCSSPDSWDYSWVLVGNGGMVSTVGDLHRWVIALQGDRVLSAAAKRSIGFDRRLRQGFGTAGGSSQHEFNAVIAFNGKRDITVVAISNRNTLPAEDFAGSLLKQAVAEDKAASD